MKSTFIRTGISIVLFAGLAAFQNCAKVKVGGVESASAQSNLSWDNECNNTELQTLQTPVRVLLIVDTSGSNVGDPKKNIAATDPNKTMRARSIEKFYADYSGKVNLGWGFIHFQEDFASALTGSNFGAASVMPKAIADFKAVRDDDATPYKSAINLAKLLINSDSGADPDTKYMVVFMSDGMPTDYDKDNNEVITQQGITALNADVTSLINLKSAGKITFSTVYYGPNHSYPSNLMLGMATAGKGQFLDVNLYPGARLDLVGSVVTVPGSVNCPM